MVLPERQHAHQDVGSAQQRRVSRGRAADRDVAPAARRRDHPVHQVRLGRQVGGDCVLVQRVDHLDQLGPRCGRVQVDLQHAGVRGDAQADGAGVTRDAVALQHDGHAHLLRRLGDRAEERDGVVESGERREEHAVVAVALLDAQRAGGRFLRRDDVGRLGGRPGRRAARRQRRTRGERRRVRDVGRTGPRHLVERQPEAHRQIARLQGEVPAPPAPRRGGPAHRCRGHVVLVLG